MANIIQSASRVTVHTMPTVVIVVILSANIDGATATVSVDFPHMVAAVAWLERQGINDYEVKCEH